MKLNNKAITTLQITALIVIIVIAVVAAAFVLGSAPAVASQPVTAYIEGIEQTGNYTEPQTLDWGAVTPGNTYTKNFTVFNKSEQTLLLKLYTTEPVGTAQSWAKNLTTIAPTDTAQATLVLSLNETAQSGAYTWRLVAVNSTATPTPSPSVSPTPTSTPTPTPEPNTLEYTVNWHEGIDNITVTVKTSTPFTIFGDEEQPRTYLFTTGDKITFEAKIKEGYEWVRWEFADGTSPVGDAKTSITRTGNFSITAVAKLIP